MKMSVCEAYSTHTPSGQCDTGDVIQMEECAAYISRPAEKKQWKQQETCMMILIILIFNRTLIVWHLECV